MRRSRTCFKKSRQFHLVGYWDRGTTLYCFVKILFMHIANMSTYEEYAVWHMLSPQPLSFTGNWVKVCLYYYGPHPVILPVFFHVRSKLGLVQQSLSPSFHWNDFHSIKATHTYGIPTSSVHHKNKSQFLMSTQRLQIFFQETYSEAKMYFKMLPSGEAGVLGVKGRFQ